MNKKEQKKIFNNYFKKLIVLVGFLKLKKDSELVNIDLELKRIRMLTKDEKLNALENLIETLEEHISTNYKE